MVFTWKKNGIDRFECRRKAGKLKWPKNLNKTCIDGKIGGMRIVECGSKLMVRGLSIINKLSTLGFLIIYENSNW